ncbi:hypothetical protein KI387_039824, partial [Taxus chinensis]
NMSSIGHTPFMKIPLIEGAEDWKKRDDDWFVEMHSPENYHGDLWLFFVDEDIVKEVGMVLNSKVIDEKTLHIQ